jgi:type IV secretory pathway VirB4 component
MPLTTQEILEIEDIKEGVLILKDKSLRGILAVSSLNFALKSEEERNAIIYQFQNFLNSLDFPIQIYILSRRLNLTGYLERLEELEKKLD